MALIECFECGNQVSDAAIVCPNCGIAIANNISLNKKNRVANLITAFVKTGLGKQIFATLLMWLAAGIFIYAVLIDETGSSFKIILLIAGFAGLFRAFISTKRETEEKERRMSTSSVIEHGIKKATSSAYSFGNGIGELITLCGYWIFWLISYVLIFSTSVPLAIGMSGYILYKVLKKNHE